MKSVLLVVAMLVLLAPAAFAKRAAPVEVTPVTNAGIEYRAPSGVEKMGVVEAWDKATDKMVWEKKVYEVSIDPNLEKDVQHVFITKMKIDAGKLIVTNEKDDRYSIDLKTQEVTKVAGEDRSESTAPVSRLKDATDVDLLCRHWVHSREEEQPADKGQLFRPAGSKEFPPSRFRMAYKFSKDGTCEWRWLSPSDAHRMKSGTWSLDPEAPTVLRIDKGKQGGVEAFRIMELSKNALRLERVNSPRDKDR